MKKHHIQAALWLLLLSLWLSAVSAQPVATAPASAPSTTQATTAPSAAEAQYARWLADLADPAMEGRRFGTPAADRAAKYIVEQYKAMRLVRGAFKDGGYLQPFKSVVGREVVSQSLVLQDAKGKPLLTAKADVDFHAISQSGGKVTGRFAFAGYSVVNPAAKYDSYADMPPDGLKGQVVVLLRYEPQDEKGKGLWGPRNMQRASIYFKVALAAKRGAAAVLIVNPAGHEKDPDIRSGPLGPRAVPVMQITPDLLKRILVAVGESDGNKALADLQAAADKGAVHKQYKDFRVALELRTQNVIGESSNVAAMLPGCANLADEVIVVGAHYDHVGFEMDKGRKVVYYGADDNASGTCGVLLLAKRYTSRLTVVAEAAKPRRSILFVNFTGEEEGLLGSQYLLKHLPESLRDKKIVAMINLDMIGRVRDRRLWIYGTDSSPGWKAIIDAAAKDSPLKIWSGGDANGPSDYASFNAAKIPSIEFFTGMHGDVHQPTDTVDKINVAGAVQTVDVAMNVLRAAAAQADPLAYSGAHRQSAVMGIVPGEGDGKELAIRRVMPDGPADKAGMQAGDVILTLDGKAMGDDQQLIDALSKCKPGQKVQCVLRRGQEVINLIVILGAR